MATALHVHRNGSRAGVPVVVVDAVVAAARPAVPGIGQRRGRRDRLRHRRLPRLAGAVHALEGRQPARAGLGVARGGRRRHHRPDPDDHLLPRLAGRGTRPERRSANDVLGPSADRGALDSRAVHLRGDRPADRQAHPVPGPAVESRCSTAGFPGRGGGLASCAVHRAAERRRRARRDGLPQQDLCRGQRRDRPRLPRADVEVSIRRAGFVGHLGVARPSGPGVRVGRPDASKS